MTALSGGSSIYAVYARIYLILSHYFLSQSIFCVKIFSTFHSWWNIFIQNFSFTRYFPLLIQIHFDFIMRGRKNAYILFRNAYILFRNAYILFRNAYNWNRKALFQNPTNPNHTRIVYKYPILGLDGFFRIVTDYLGYKWSVYFHCCGPLLRNMKSLYQKGLVYGK